MKPAALVVTSVKHYATAQEALRVKDTVSALRRCGWSVDVLTPRVTALLSFSLDPDVRVFTVPKLPFVGMLMFLRGVALVSRRNYMVMHGFDEGAGIARAVDRATTRRFAYVAEIHHPECAGRSTVSHASAIIVPDEDTLASFRHPPPKARVSILPDPHADLVENAFTTAEFSSALDAIYTYVRRTRPEIEKI